MQSTMQDVQLNINMIFRHGLSTYADSRVITCEADGARIGTYREVADHAAQLAHALAELGVGESDRVGTFCWNNQEHVEAYFAIPCMGAVLHTLNIRLFPEDLSYVINHAEDKVILVDDTLVPLLARVADQLDTVEHIIVVGAGDASLLDGAKAKVHRYAELLDGRETEYPWPDVDERSAAAMCYTSGTTGRPKGVVYSHRSSVLHALGVASGNAIAISERDRILSIVPMFHANAWGLPHVGWFMGADFVMPDRFLQAEPLCRIIREYRPTISGAVPTIWNEVLRYADDKKVDFSSFRTVLCGGSAVPRSLMEAFEERYDLEILQGWGMTETSPLGSLARPPKGTPEGEQMEWRVKTGRILPGIELRIVDDEGNVLARDGKAVGEIEARGVWVTGSYYKNEDPGKFHDGWLRTGDVGSIDAKGFVQITDRAKDVIKSGGEWISSVDLENQLMGHPKVREAAVVGVPDERWDERPLACVVADDGVSAEELRQYLAERVAKWWLPERWTFIEEVPKTSVGKFDKKVLRARYGDGDLKVETLG
ncbi:MAG: fatty acid--CoA ligase [Acidobacteria bacterium]|nr:MAG: fatty acid--CoA ligase [Acidobacteriota bacterium]REK00103.1 MAG: fatty acid--CoA ligase [Acidobacteriota bacterium]